MTAVKIEQRPNCICGRPATLTNGKWVGCNGMRGGQKTVIDSELVRSA